MGALFGEKRGVGDSLRLVVYGEAKRVDKNIILGKKQTSYNTDQSQSQISVKDGFYFVHYVHPAISSEAR